MKLHMFGYPNITTSNLAQQYSNGSYINMSGHGVDPWLQDTVKWQVFVNMVLRLHQLSEYHEVIADQIYDQPQSCKTIRTSYTVTV